MNNFDAIIYLGNNNPLKYKRGVENVILSQSMAFNCSKYYIFIGESKKIFFWENICCIEVPQSKFQLHFIEINRIINFIKKKYENKIFIHGHQSIISLFTFSRIDLFTVHDGLYYLRKSVNHRFRYIHFIIEKVVYFKVKHIHFISEFTKNNSLISDKSKKFTIIPNTTPLELLKNKNEIRNPFFNNSFNIFTVRGIQERTRIDLLIQFAEFVKNKKINGEFIKIFISGKGPLLEYYKNIIANKKLNNILLLGFVPDDIVCNYYSNCNLVIVPAEYGEGFGLPIIEGYLFDKPVMASNRCAIPEVILSSKYLFENNVENIWTVLNNISISESVDFYTFYNQRYSHSVISESVRKMYNNIS